MSLRDFAISREITRSDPPFYALIMAAMRQADTSNLTALSLAFPRVYVEFARRHNAPGGAIPEDRGMTS